MAPPRLNPAGQVGDRRDDEMLLAQARNPLQAAMAAPQRALPPPPQGVIMNPNPATQMLPSPLADMSVDDRTRFIQMREAWLNAMQGWSPTGPAAPGAAAAPFFDFVTEDGVRLTPSGIPFNAKDVWKQEGRGRAFPRIPGTDIYGYPVTGDPRAPGGTPGVPGGMSVAGPLAPPGVAPDDYHAHRVQQKLRAEAGPVLQLLGAPDIDGARRVWWPSVSHAMGVNDPNQGPQGPVRKVLEDLASVPSATMRRTAAESINRTDRNRLAQEELDIRRQTAIAGIEGSADVLREGMSGPSTGEPPKSLIREYIKDITDETEPEDTQQAMKAARGIDELNSTEDKKSTKEQKALIKALQTLGRNDLLAPLTMEREGKETGMSDALRQEILKDLPEEEKAKLEGLRRVRKGLPAATTEEQRKAREAARQRWQRANFGLPPQFGTFQ